MFCAYDPSPQHSPLSAGARSVMRSQLCANTAHEAARRVSLGAGRPIPAGWRDSGTGPPRKSTCSSPVSSQSPHVLYSPAETVLTCVVPRALRQHLCRCVLACDGCQLEDTLSHFTCGGCECALRMRILSLCVRAFSLPCGAVREAAPYRAIVHELLDQVDGRVVLRGRDVNSDQIERRQLRSDQTKHSIHLSPGRFCDGSLRGQRRRSCRVARWGAEDGEGRVGGGRVGGGRLGCL